MNVQQALTESRTTTSSTTLGCALLRTAPKQYGDTRSRTWPTQYGLDQVDRHRPARRGPRATSTARRSASSCTPSAGRLPEHDWYTGDNIEMAFGQGGTVVTPIELANAYATFANGGTRYQPQVAAAVVDAANGKVVKTFPPKVTGHVSIPPRTTSHLAGLRGRGRQPRAPATAPSSSTPSSPEHTSRSPARPARRTCTASATGKEPNAWFVGFGPSPNPQYVVARGRGPGRLRRPGRRPGGHEHLQLPGRPTRSGRSAAHREQPAADHAGTAHRGPPGRRDHHDDEHHAPAPRTADAPRRRARHSEATTDGALAHCGRRRRANGAELPALDE